MATRVLRGLLGAQPGSIDYGKVAKSIGRQREGDFILPMYRTGLALWELGGNNRDLIRTSKSEAVDPSFYDIVREGFQSNRGGRNLVGGYIRFIEEGRSVKMRPAVFTDIVMGEGKCAVALRSVKKGVMLEGVVPLVGALEEYEAAIAQAADLVPDTMERIRELEGEFWAIKDRYRDVFGFREQSNSHGVLHKPKE